MAYRFKREEKYEVLKIDDLNKYLSETEQDNLMHIISVIQDGRVRDGKPACNKYVVVNEEEPYAEEVWGLIELHEKE